MKKRFLGLTLALAMLIGCLPIIANAEITASGECGAQGDNVTWTLDSEGTLTISGTGDMYNYRYAYNRSPFDKNTDIKSIIIENGVTSIGVNMFSCINLTSVIIPDSVTSIYNGAFSGCSSLKSITIPDSVSLIDSAFGNCTSLTDITVNPNNQTYMSIDGVLFNKSQTEIVNYPAGNRERAYTIPDGVTVVADSAFWGCYNLETIAIPNSVTSIENDAFCRCTSLTSITIPNSVTNIGSSVFNGCESLTNVLMLGNITSINDYMFRNCSALTSVIIPDGVTDIGSYAFNGCTSLSNITIPDSVANIGYYAFENTAYYKDSLNWTDNVLYIGNHLIKANEALSGECKIKDGIKSISPTAFKNCVGLTSVKIPSSVTNIGDSVFDGCKNLDSIYISNIAAWCNIDFSRFGAPFSYANKLYLNDELVADLVIPEGITKIGEGAFDGYTGLTSISIPDSVTKIGDYAFRECTGLTNVTISDNVESISDYAFYGCTELRSVKLSKSLVSIGDYAFNGCESLTSITLPDSVASIGDHAFRSCTSLTSFKIPDSVTSIGENAFYDTGYHNDLSKWTDHVLYIGKHLVAADVLLKSYEIKNGTKTIAGAGFYKCSDLTSVTIPDSVISIGGSAFYDCTSLKSIIIPDSVKSIENHAFGRCTNLNSISIPDSVTRIGGYAFRYCSNLTSIIIPDSVTSIGEEAFYKCDGLTDVYYGGTETQWQAIEIDKYNDSLTNAAIHYTGGDSITPTPIPAIPITTAEIVRTDTDTDTAYTFEVDAAEKYADCFVYAAIYDENGALSAVNRVPLETAEKTSISADKSANDVFAKIFIWSNANQPTIKAKEFTITNGSFDNK